MARIKNRSIDYGRLAQAVVDSRRALEPFRTKQRDMVRQYVGHWWGDGGTEERVPINLLALYVQTMTRSLAPKCPSVMLSTDSAADRPAVEACQDWANAEFKRMKLETKLQRCVLQAFFTQGITKVALASPADAAMAGWNVKAGGVMCANISMDDFVYDIYARDYDECGFIGHRYRVPLDAVKDDSKNYSKRRKDLVASDNDPYNWEGDERLETMGRAGQTFGDEFEEHVDLWELYLPRHRCVVTIADSHIQATTSSRAAGKYAEPLREQDWIGWELGPYHILRYGLVPDNAMGKGPIADLIDLAEATNRTYRKATRTVDRMKEITLVAGGADADGKRILDASDGQMILVDNPERIKTVVFGGAALQAALGMATEFRNTFNYAAGNLELAAGLGPQSKTATQDKMLNENAGRGVADMQERTINHAGSVMEAHCWYWWKDPFTVQEATYSPPGLPEMTAVRKVYPASHPDPTKLRRTLPWEQLRPWVDPYSMQHSTPASKAAALAEIATQVIIPMAPILQQQGIQFNIDGYLKRLKVLLDITDLDEIVTIAEPPAPTGPTTPDDQGGGMPASTTRNYVRQNVSEKTRTGQDKTLINTMMGGKVQPAERDPSTMSG